MQQVPWPLVTPCLPSRASAEQIRNALGEVGLKRSKNSAGGRASYECKHRLPDILHAGGDSVDAQQ